MTIDAGGNSRIFTINPGARVALRGLTLTGGRTSNGSNGSNSNTGGNGEDGEDGGNGGGIFAGNNSTLTLSACTISGNQTGQGGDGGDGGSGNSGGDGGRGGFGGGIFADFNSTLTLSACTISGNQTGQGGDGGDGGGGGEGFGGFGGRGGGIFAGSNTTLTLTACTVSGNLTGQGGDGGDGGFSSDGGFGGDGGGIFAGSTTAPTTLTLTACTVSGNRTGQGGLSNNGEGNIGRQGSSGGVSVFNSTVVTIGQSIIAGNIGLLDDFGTGDIDFPLGNNLLGGDPKLAPLGFYGGPTQTMHPLAGSPAILDTLAVSPPAPTSAASPSLDPPTIGAVKVGPVTLKVIKHFRRQRIRFAIEMALSASNNTDGTGHLLQAQNLRRRDGRFLLSTVNFEIASNTSKGLTIYASNLPNGLTIDANQRSRVMLIDENATAAFHGLTFTGGRTSDGLDGFDPPAGLGDDGEDAEDSDDGGGIFVASNGTLNLTACTISDNQTGSGGEGGDGGFNEDNTFTSRGGEGGDSGDGGGLFVASNGTLSLTACTISGNQTGDAGSRRPKR